MESHGFSFIIHCTEKNNVRYFFIMVMFFYVFVLVIVSINPCITFKTILAGSDNTNLNIILFS